MSMLDDKESSNNLRVIIALVSFITMGFFAAIYVVGGQQAAKTPTSQAGASL